jgi:hypothetical protein
VPHSISNSMFMYLYFRIVSIFLMLRSPPGRAVGISRGRNDLIGQVVGLPSTIFLAHYMPSNSAE